MNKYFIFPALFLLVGSGCMESSREVGVSFYVETEMNEWDEPVSQVYLGVKDVIPPGVDFVKDMGSDYGCTVTEAGDFVFPEDSLTETYCYWAGGGSLFQAHVITVSTPTEHIELEVRRYDVSEVPSYEDQAYSVEFTGSESIYTFRPNPGITFVSGE
jgi:hypothetical protein